MSWAPRRWTPPVPTGPPPRGRYQQSRELQRSRPKNSPGASPGGRTDSRRSGRGLCSDRAARTRRRRGGGRARRGGSPLWSRCPPPAPGASWSPAPAPARAGCPSGPAPRSGRTDPSPAGAPRTDPTRPHRDVEGEPVVDPVRVVLPEIPLDPRAPEHGPGTGVAHRIVRCQDPDPLDPFLPDDVVRAQAVVLRQARREPGEEGLDGGHAPR